MVCKKCEKKLTTLAAPDKWKDGSKNVLAGSSGRKLNQNKLLSRSAKLSRFNPLESKCKICKTKVHQDKAHYCQDCAYKKGICAMCGKQVLDTSSYKQTAK
ncbi:PDZ-binding protein [Mucor mucedo]|uniref:PDZ-binding protein n=1 Tax=Mucor mucedo TaxID=29922 RepID=UPI00222020D2|nr:PDZ-binding protein [Mucor mucedo]KAI7872612.1 PDZ-binding protein [Mucor mucedo]